MSSILYKKFHKLFYIRKLQFFYVREVLMSYSYTWEIKQPLVVLEMSVKCELQGTRWIK